MSIRPVLGLVAAWNILIVPHGQSIEKTAIRAPNAVKKPSKKLNFSYASVRTKKGYLETKWNHSADNVLVCKATKYENKATLVVNVYGIKQGVAAGTEL